MGVQHLTENNGKGGTNLPSDFPLLPSSLSPLPPILLVLSFPHIPDLVPRVRIPPSPPPPPPPPGLFADRLEAPTTYGPTEYEDEATSFPLASPLSTPPSDRSFVDVRGEIGGRVRVMCTYTRGNGEECTYTHTYRYVP